MLNGLRTVRGWIWPQERYPPAARKYGHGLGLFADIARVRWSRAKLLKALTKTLPSAADTCNRLDGGLGPIWLPH